MSGAASALGAGESRLLMIHQGAQRSIRFLDQFVRFSLDDLLCSSAPRRSTVRAPGMLVRRGRIRVIREPIPGAVEAYAIGERIRESRLRQGLRQEDLATAARISRPNIVRIEHGKHMPSVRSLARIAEALGISLQDLLAPFQPAPMTDEEKQLAEAGLQDFVEALEREDRMA